MEKKSDAKEESADRFVGRHSVSLKLGVWRLVMLKADSFDIAKNIRDISSALLLFLRMVSEIYALAPLLTTFYVVAELSGLCSLLATESTLTLYLTSRLLKAVCLFSLYSHSSAETLLIGGDWNFGGHRKL